MKSADEIKSNLPHYYGSENLYRHSLTRLCYTDGVQYIASAGDAYWLLDEVLLRAKAFAPSVPFQVWELKKIGDRASLTLTDGDDNVSHISKIEYTDFPLDEIRFYVVNDVMMLPSEY